MTNGEKWAINESLLQSYRGIFIMSQTFLLVIGVLLIDTSFPFWLMGGMFFLALVMVAYMWFPITRSRSLIVDFYKFKVKYPDLDAFDGIEEIDYLDEDIRKKINSKIKEKNLRLTRMKIDILLPVMFICVWLLLIGAKRVA